MDKKEPTLFEELMSEWASSYSDIKHTGLILGKMPLATIGPVKLNHPKEWPKPFLIEPLEIRFANRDK